MQARPAQHGRSTASTYSPTGSARSSVSEWLPIESPKTTAAATSQRSAVGAVIADAVLPADEQAQEDRHEREVEGVRVGVRADRPDDRGQREPDPRGDAE